ncbi:hypothetical protein [Streptomyces sp. NPDC057052]|uniref:hypothetical protein n=1 Tax=Streptomyces sp. NPDC057052 TaxID=3346010 RepID=UPI0036262C33
MQIVRLAATGLTNRQIGERLLLSARYHWLSPLPDVSEVGHHQPHPAPRRPQRSGLLLNGRRAGGRAVPRGGVAGAAGTRATPPP